MEKSAYQPMKPTKEEGFTLLEVMIVLSVMAMLLWLSIPTVHTLYVKTEEKKLIETMQYDILYVQSQAIGSVEEIRITLYKNSYTIVDKGGKVMERNLPAGFEIDRRTLENISFTETGSIRKAGTIKITTPISTYKLIFPPGKGRGRLEKQ